MKQKYKWIKILGIVVIVIILVIVLFICGLLGYRQYNRSKIQKDQQILSENGINEGRTVTINGLQQYIHLRGENIHNPIILVLHGGPGSPIFPMSYTYQQGLEKDYTVVNWDQRNAGKTYFLNEEKTEEILSDISIATYVQDTYELVQYLRNSLKQEVIIMGHSWGSTLGALFVSQYPEEVKAYIGVGQNLCLNEGELLIVEEMLKVVSGKDREKYLNIIGDGGPIQFGNDAFDAVRFSNHRKLSGKYLMPGVVADAALVKMTMLSPYYTLKDITWFMKDNLSLQGKILNELGTIDLRKTITSFEIPVIFISGNLEIGRASCRERVLRLV